MSMDTPYSSPIETGDTDASWSGVQLMSPILQKPLLSPPSPPPQLSSPQRPLVPPPLPIELSPLNLSAAFPYYDNGEDYFYYWDDELNPIEKVKEAEGEITNKRLNGKKNSTTLCFVGTRSFDNLQRMKLKMKLKMKGTLLNQDADGGESLHSLSLAHLVAFAKVYGSIRAYLTNKPSAAPTKPEEEAGHGGWETSPPTPFQVGTVLQSVPVVHLLKHLDLQPAEENGLRLYLRPPRCDSLTLYIECCEEAERTGKDDAIRISGLLAELSLMGASVTFSDWSLCLVNPFLASLDLNTRINLVPDIDAGAITIDYDRNYMQTVPMGALQMLASVSSGRCSVSTMGSTRRMVISNKDDPDPILKVIAIADFRNVKQEDKVAVELASGFWSSSLPISTGGDRCIVTGVPVIIWIPPTPGFGRGPVFMMSCHLSSLLTVDNIDRDALLLEYQIMYGDDFTKDLLDRMDGSTQEDQQNMMQEMVSNIVSSCPSIPSTCCIPNDTNGYNLEDDGVNDVHIASSSTAVAYPSSSASPPPNSASPPPTLLSKSSFSSSDYCYVPSPKNSFNPPLPGRTC